MFAIFGRVGGGHGSEVEVAVPPPSVRVDGGTPATPFVTLTRRDGREWVLTMNEVPGLIKQLQEAMKRYAKSG